VALIDEIPKRSSIALDTDAIIYYVEDHDRFLPVIERQSEQVLCSRRDAARVAGAQPMRGGLWGVSPHPLILSAEQADRDGQPSSFRPLLTNGVNPGEVYASDFAVS
jgi:hypothetical protein